MNRTSYPRSRSMPHLKSRAIVPTLTSILSVSTPAALLTILILISAQGSAQPQAQSLTPALSNDQTQSLVKSVLQTELEASQDLSHPMQYRLRKTSPRYSTIKQIIETRDGDVARLIAVNNAALSPADQQVEDDRLAALLTDPERQHHRQEREQGDAERARKILRALPNAFLYTFAGVAETPHGPSYRLNFQPNPDFNPEDLEAQALKAMAGELWIDVTEHRVTRLEGKRLHDVDYGWGLIGKLQQGGTLLLEQADVGDHQWRTTHMVLAMNARILVKTIKLDTTLELSQFTSVPSGIDYRAAIHLLQAHPNR